MTEMPMRRKGFCPVCNEEVKLIYENPEKRDKLVIGPHHPPLKSCKLEDIGNMNCSGVRRLPRC